MISWNKKEDITWMPGLRPSDDGWLVVDKEPMIITNWHHYDDFGQTVETVTVKDAAGDEAEYYSMDEGQSWCSEVD